MQELEHLRDTALAAALAASGVVREEWRQARATSAETKTSGDYVAEVDRLAEEAAVAVLAERTPDIPVLTEESGGSTADRRWVLDPVDGTTNLVHGFPVVGVSVALMEAGRPVAGAVVAPMLGEAWTALDGGGAHDASGGRLQIADRPAAQAVVATGFPFREKARKLPRYRPVLDSSLERFEDLRRAGAASLDLAYTAAGAFDGFFELGLSLWDIAAGALLVREAGGVVTDWGGDAHAVFTSGDIVAGSPAWHAAMLELIAGRART